VIGSNSDQNSVAPAVTLGSVVIDLPHALVMVAAEVRDGLFIPRVIKLGVQQQVIKLVINPSIGPGIPPAARVAVDSVQRSFVMGHAPHIDLGRDTAVSAAAPPVDTAARAPAVVHDSALPANAGAQPASDTTRKP